MVQSLFVFIQVNKLLFLTYVFIYLKSERKLEILRWCTLKNKNKINIYVDVTE